MLCGRGTKIPVGDDTIDDAADENGMELEVCSGIDGFEDSRIEAPTAVARHSRNFFTAACLSQATFSGSKTCATRRGRSDGRSGWTYSGLIRRLASMLSISFDSAEETA